MDVRVYIWIYIVITKGSVLTVLYATMHNPFYSAIFVRILEAFPTNVIPCSMDCYTPYDFFLSQFWILSHCDF